LAGFATSVAVVAQRFGLLLSHHHAEAPIIVGRGLPPDCE